MAVNYFARVNEIHKEFMGGEDVEFSFEDLFEEEGEANQSTIMEDLIWQSIEPLFSGSSTRRLQFSIILMLSSTLFSFSRHGLDKILTFLKHDILPSNNSYPKNSYKMKLLFMKLGLSHESINCYDCSKT